MAEDQQKNPIIAVFTNLVSAIKLPLPFPPNKNNHASSSSSSSQAETIKIEPAAVSEDAKIVVYNKPAVTFPKRTEDFAPLKLEAEIEDAERRTNPLLLWQVYAVGGAFILRWAWTRWNERKGKKKSDDEPPPSHD